MRGRYNTQAQFNLNGMTCRPTQSTPNLPPEFQGWDPPWFQRHSIEHRCTVMMPFAASLCVGSSICKRRFQRTTHSRWRSQHLQTSFPAPLLRHYSSARLQFQHRRPRLQHGVAACSTVAHGCSSAVRRFQLHGAPVAAPWLAGCRTMLAGCTTVARRRCRGRLQHGGRLPAAPAVDSRRVPHVFDMDAEIRTNINLWNKKKKSWCVICYWHISLATHHCCLIYSIFPTFPLEIHVIYNTIYVPL